MTARPLRDSDQEAPPPQGHVIGFVDTRPEYEMVVKTLRDAGYPDSKITVLHGEEGIHILEPDEDAFEFGEAESRMMHNSMIQLRQGHYRIEIAVADREEALRVARLITPQGAHTVGYYGSIVSELLTI
jgi:hypothetical protein